MARLKSLLLMALLILIACIPAKAPRNAIGDLRDGIQIRYRLSSELALGAIDVSQSSDHDYTLYNLPNKSYDIRVKFLDEKCDSYRYPVPPDILSICISVKDDRDKELVRYSGDLASWVRSSDLGREPERGSCYYEAPLMLTLGDLSSIPYFGLYSDSADLMPISFGNRTLLARVGRGSFRAASDKDKPASTPGFYASRFRHYYVRISVRHTTSNPVTSQPVQFVLAAMW